MALKGFKSEGKGGSKFAPLDEGVYIGRLVQLIDLGTQKDEYQGVVTERPKVMFTFELPTETVSIDGEDKPRFLSIELTASLHEKAKMTGFVKSLDPSAPLNSSLNLVSLLGKEVQLNIGKTKTGNAKITGSLPLARGQIVPQTGTPTVVFDFDEPDMEVFNKLPNFVQEKIRGALNFSEENFQGATKPVM